MFRISDSSLKASIRVPLWNHSDPDTLFFCPYKMEGDLEYSTVNYQGAILHVFEIQGVKHMLARASEWALYNTAMHSGSLNRALAKAELPELVQLRRSALGHVTEHEYSCLLRMHMEFQHSLDPTLRSPKMLSAVLLSSVETVAHVRGLRPLLEALSLEVPMEWVLEDQQAALATEHLVDLLVDEQLDELRQLSLPEELVGFESFEPDSADEERLKGYALAPSRHMRSQLDAYQAHKTRTFAYDRDSGAVRDITAMGDIQSVLRFCGWLSSVDVIITDLRDLLAVEPVRTQAYCSFLIDQRGASCVCT
jgi:hypothetical protein